MRPGRLRAAHPQDLARGLIADGRETEVQEIREFISGIVPDPDPNGAARTASATQTLSTDKKPR